MPEDEFDPLDRLLDEARWPSPPVGAVERLRGQWQAMTARPAMRRRALVGGLLVAAAVLFVAVLTAWLAGHGSRDRTSPDLAGSPQVGRSGANPDHPQPAGPERRAAEPAARAMQADDPGLKPVVSRKTPPDERIVPRPPTPYEQVLIAAARRQARKADGGVTVAAGVQRAAPALGPSRAPGAVAIHRPAQSRRDPLTERELCASLLRRGDPPSIRSFLQRVADPQISALALSCVDSGDPPAEMLMEFLTSPDRSQRIAAARVLGRLNRPGISRRLIEMVRLGAYRQEALVGLMSSSEPSAQEFLTFAERDPLLWATVWNARRLFETLTLWRS